MTKRICPICEQVMKGSHYCSECRGFVRHPRIINVDYYLNERHSSNERGCEYHNPSFMEHTKPGTVKPQAKSGQTVRRKSSYPFESPIGGRKNGNIGLVVAVIVFIIFFLNLILPFLMYSI